MNLFDGMSFRGKSVLRPEPIVQEEGFSEGVQEEFGGTVLILGVNFA